MNSFPTPRELAAEALQALRETRMTPQEHWEFLIENGIIDRNGKVLVNRYFPTDIPYETNGPAAPADAPEKKQD